MINWKKLSLKNPQDDLQKSFNCLLEFLQNREEKIQQQDRIIESIATCGYQLIQGNISNEDFKFCLDNSLPEEKKSFIEHKYIHKDIDKLTTEEDIKKFIEEIENTPFIDNIDNE